MVEMNVNEKSHINRRYENISSWDSCIGFFCSIASVTSAYEKNIIISFCSPRFSGKTFLRVPHYKVQAGKHFFWTCDNVIETTFFHQLFLVSGSMIYFFYTCRMGFRCINLTKQNIYIFFSLEHVFLKMQIRRYFLTCAMR